MTDPTPPKPWNVTALLAEIELRYKNNATLARYWDSERAGIKGRIDALNERLFKQYGEPKILGVGGQGIVLKLLDLELSEQPVALKFSRPVQDQLGLLTHLLDKEIRHLAALRHTCIVRIHNRGILLDKSTSPKAQVFSYYVMDFLAGEDSDVWLKTESPSEEGFVSLIASTLAAVDYLHSKRTAHLDIKPPNIRITPDGTPVISDLGTAKQVATDFATTVAVTSGYVHPDLARILSQDPSDPNRVKGSISPEQIKLKWDLFSLGKTLLNWIGYALAGEELPRSHRLRPYARKYLLLMAARMLDGNVDDWLESKLGLDRALLRELAYRDAAEALADVRKLSGEFSLVDKIPELNAYHPNTLQIAADGPTTYSDRLKRLVTHKYVQRLSSISQLGLVNQVYPTAVHSRFEHSVGTYHNTCRCILSLYYDPLSPLFRQIVTEKDLKVLLVSALLHDIGQYPLAHDLEEIDERFDHRRLGRSMLNGPDGTDLDEVLSEWGVGRSEVLAVLDAKLEETAAPLKTRLLHSVIDGPLDADKLDYLLRDSDRLRVPYANGIDIERVLRSLTVIVKPENRRNLACIGVHEKARVAAEFVAIARYALFSQAYWHHAVRAMKAMLSRAVWRVIDETASLHDTWHGTWLEDFLTFVRRLPGAAYEIRVADVPDSPLSAMDAAVVRFLLGLLKRCSAPEAELLEDLTRRSLYKRLLVFSPERADGWTEIVRRWDKCGPRTRLSVVQDMERDIIQKVRETRGLSKLAMDAATRAVMRAEANRPLVLIDVPGDRPGSSVPLYYVVEAQRRALRKDERVVGDVQPSAIWEKFASELRERAGKVRVFCAPELTDILEPVIDRKQFLASFEEAMRRRGPGGSAA